MAVHTRLGGVLELARPGNVVGAAALAFVGVYVAAGLTRPIPMAAAMAATGLGTAAGNAVNDYFDRDIDAVNRPGRPIPSGRVAPREAALVSAVAFAVALVVTIVLLPLAAVAIAALNLVLLVTYTQVFKGTPGLGNAVVAFLVGSAIWFGGAAGGDLVATLVIGALAAFATVAREIVKDIEDLPGDRSAGIRTLPIAIGTDRAWLIAGVGLALGGVISPIPYLDGTLGRAYLVALVPAIAIMGYGWLRGLDRPGYGQGLLKVGMYVALAGFVLGRVELPL